MKDLQGGGTIIQLGWVVALAALVPLGLGLWLDQLFSVSPLFVLVGGLCGVLAGTAGVLRVTGRAIDRLGSHTQAPSGELDRKENEGQ